MTGTTWDTRRLGDAFEVIAGNPAPKNVVPCSGALDLVPFVRVQDLGRLGNSVYIHTTKDALPEGDSKRLRLFPKGTVLFTKSGMSTLLNQRAILARPMHVVGHIGAVLPNEDAAPEWVYYWLKQKDLGRLAHATTLPSLPLTKVRELEIPLPAKPVQDQIVQALDSYFSRLDEVEAGLERVQRNLKRYRASVLQAAVTGRLVPTEAELARVQGREYEPASELLKRILAERRRRWEELVRRGQYQEPALADTSNLPELPEGWCWATVEQLALISSGETPKGIAKKLRSAGAFPWFRVGDMNLPGNEEWMANSRSWVSMEEAGLLGLSPRPPGTIVFPKRGGAIQTNKKRRLAVIGAYDLNTMGLIPIGDAGDYIWLWLLGVDLGQLADGSNVPQLNHGDIAPLTLPVPPAAEQARIRDAVARSLSLSENVFKGVQAARARAGRIRQALLHSAFEGRLLSNHAAGREKEP